MGGKERGREEVGESTGSRNQRLGATLGRWQLLQPSAAAAAAATARSAPRNGLFGARHLRRDDPCLRSERPERLEPSV